ncbi:MAG TPA: sigma-70 family RNA polymerase sigma factor, partial [Casimicrobiaceae bacterium]|nr:sigma-70 family RNA polymerase sigma factor [Casimicrobiaceae bacterium]
IAKTLGVKREEVLEMEMRLSGQDVALDPMPTSDDEAPTSPIAWLVDDSEDPSQRLERVQVETRRSDGLKDALGKLDSRSRRIIESRWLREDDQATLQELADEYGVSAERIRQIESKALKQMRGAMAEVA